MKKDLVLLINGAGTNGSELKTLYKELAKNEKYFVYYPGIMPGVFIGDHFPKSKTKDFIAFVDSTLEMINQPEFENVYIIGYSLGALTSTMLTVKSDKVDKLILVAPLLNNPNYRKFMKGLALSLAHSKSLTRVQKIFYNEFIKRILKVPKMHLFYLQMYFHFAKRYLSQITKPVLLIETLKDELVKTKS